MYLFLVRILLLFIKLMLFNAANMVTSIEN